MDYPSSGRARGLRDQGSELSTRRWNFRTWTCGPSDQANWPTAHKPPCLSRECGLRWNGGRSDWSPRGTMTCSRPKGVLMATIVDAARASGSSDCASLKGRCRHLTSAPVEPLKYIVGRDGAVFTIADLPPSTTARWVIRRKADVVAAVQGGLISTEDACARYGLTPEEFQSWCRAVQSFGLKGLRVTCIQNYRQGGVEPHGIRHHADG